jgi:hypothetical protein
LDWSATTGALPGPARLHEYPVLLAEVARRRCNDGALANYNFAALFQGLANVVFTYKVGGLVSFWTLSC